MINFRVRLPYLEAADMIENYVIRSAISAELVDRYTAGDRDFGMVVLVFEKYYMRNSSRASLSVTVQNLGGVTEVHAIGSGGGQGSLFGFDWGASGNFENTALDALGEHVY